MRQQKFCNVAERQRHRRTRGRNNRRPEKFAKPPMHQERTKTQNSTKVADTTKKNDDICEYGSYANMMSIIIERLQAREKMQHEKQADMRLAKRLCLVQRLRFSNLGFNYRDTSTARDKL